MHAEISADVRAGRYRFVLRHAAPSESEALAAAFQSRPDYRAAQAQVRAAELDLRSSRAERYPTLAFAADYGQSGRQAFHNLNTYRVQGSLNIPVFLGGRIAADVKQAESRVERAEAYLDEVRAQVETDVLSAMADVALRASARSRLPQTPSTLAQRRSGSQHGAFHAGRDAIIRKSSTPRTAWRAPRTTASGRCSISRSRRRGCSMRSVSAEKAYRP